MSPREVQSKLREYTVYLERKYQLLLNTEYK
jgi:hypothetical protein